MAIADKKRAVLVLVSFAVLEANCVAQPGIPPVIEITPIATPGAPAFRTYYFDVFPTNGNSISSVEGHFVAEQFGSMRQINPSGLLTVFEDNNDPILNAGETPLGDSQFEFRSDEAVFVFDVSESNTALNALAGVGPLTNKFALAHVVLAVGVSGTWNIGVVQTESDGIIREYQQSGTFGSNLEGPPGDYNNNGTVDAADYVVWRDALGQAGADLSADGNGDQQIDAGDYAVWRSSFGKIGGSSGGIVVVAVPEPSTCTILYSALVASGLRRMFDVRNVIGNNDQLVRATREFAQHSARFPGKAKRLAAHEIGALDRWAPILFDVFHH